MDVSKNDSSVQSRVQPKMRNTLYRYKVLHAFPRTGPRACEPNAHTEFIHLGTLGVRSLDFLGTIEVLLHKYRTRIQYAAPT